jgi:hypothetical protein
MATAGIPTQKPHVFTLQRNDPLHKTVSDVHSALLAHWIVVSMLKLPLDLAAFSVSEIDQTFFPGQDIVQAAGITSDCLLSWCYTAPA